MREDVGVSSDVFVRLLDEGVDVWRPVHAEHLHGDVYRIALQDYERDTQTWEFEPGANVVCEAIQGSTGSIFAATRLAEETRSSDQ
jgi:hypothetical protein